MAARNDDWLTSSDSYERWKRSAFVPTHPGTNVFEHRDRVWTLIDALPANWFILVGMSPEPKVEMWSFDPAATRRTQEEI